MWSMWPCGQHRRRAAADLVGKSEHRVDRRGHQRKQSDQQKYAAELSAQVTHDRNGVTVRTGGAAMVNVQITKQSQRDLLVMESIAIPLSFLVLVWVFGGLIAQRCPWPSAEWRFSAPLRCCARSRSPPTFRYSHSTSPPPWVWRWPSTTRC